MPKKCECGKDIEEGDFLSPVSAACFDQTDVDRCVRCRALWIFRGMSSAEQTALLNFFESQRVG